MSDFRARSNAELLDATFEIYRRYFPAFFTVGVVWALPSLIGAYFQTSARLGVDDVSAGLSAQQIITLVTMFMRLLITPYAEGAMTALSSDAYLGAPVDLASAGRAVFAHPFRLTIAWWTRAVFEVGGLFLFFVPGFVIFKRYFAIEQTVILEHRGVGDAIRRSRTLSDGSGSRIFLLIGGILVFTVAVTIMLSGLLTAFAQVTIAAMVSVVLLAVLFPFSIIATTLLYYDIRIRREGYDIELLTSDLDSTRNVQPLPAS